MTAVQIVCRLFVRLPNKWSARLHEQWRHQYCCCIC